MHVLAVHIGMLSLLACEPFKSCAAVKSVISCGEEPREQPGSTQEYLFDLVEFKETQFLS